MTSTTITAALQKLIVIYTPVAIRLMKDFPEAHGATFFIGKDRDYAALPNADVPEGYANAYSYEAFETLAAEVLLGVRPQTEALRDSLGIKDESDFGIYLSKGEEADQFNLRATLRCPAMYQFFTLDASIRLENEFAVCGGAAFMTMMAKGDDPKIAKLLEQAAEVGLDEVLQVITANGLMLDLDKDGEKYKKLVQPWIDRFPHHDRVMVDKIESIYQFFVIAQDSTPFCVMSAENPVFEHFKDVPMDVRQFEHIRLARDNATSVKV